MATPFLAITDFKAEFAAFGQLDAAQTITATRLLQVASDRVRELKPDANEDAAKQVVFEVVRDAALYGHLDKLSVFDNETSRRKEAGTFDDMGRAVNDLLTSRHKGMLGLSCKPAYYFGD